MSPLDNAKTLPHDYAIPLDKTLWGLYENKFKHIFYNKDYYEGLDSLYQHTDRWLEDDFSPYHILDLTKNQLIDEIDFLDYYFNAYLTPEMRTKILRIKMSSEEISKPLMERRLMDVVAGKMAEMIYKTYENEFFQAEESIYPKMIDIYYKKEYMQLTETQLNDYLSKYPPPTKKTFENIVAWFKTFFTYTGNGNVLFIQAFLHYLSTSKPSCLSKIVLIFEFSEIEKPENEIWFDFLRDICDKFEKIYFIVITKDACFKEARNISIKISELKEMRRRFCVQSVKLDQFSMCDMISQRVKKYFPKNETDAVPVFTSIHKRKDTCQFGSPLCNLRKFPYEILEKLLLSANRLTETSNLANYLINKDICRGKSVLIALLKYPICDWICPGCYLNMPPEEILSESRLLDTIVRSGNYLCPSENSQFLDNLFQISNSQSTPAAYICKCLLLYLLGEHHELSVGEIVQMMCDDMKFYRHLIESALSDFMQHRMISKNSWEAKSDFHNEDEIITLTSDGRYYLEKFMVMPEYIQPMALEVYLKNTVNIGICLPAKEKFQGDSDFKLQAFRVNAIIDHTEIFESCCNSHYQLKKIASRDFQNFMQFNQRRHQQLGENIRKQAENCLCPEEKETCEILEALFKSRKKYKML